MSGDSENPDDLIFDDAHFASGSEDEETVGKKDKIEEEVVFGDESDAEPGEDPAGADFREEEPAFHGGDIFGGDFSGEDLDEGDPDAEEDFLLDAEPEDEGLRAGDIAAALGGEPAIPQRRTADHQGEDKILFGDQTVDEPTEVFDHGNEPFTESGSGWEGHFLPADQIGIPTDDAADEDVGFRDADPLSSDLDQDFDLVMEGEELQLVDDESELDTADAGQEGWPVGAGTGPQGAGSDAGTEEGWLDAEVEEEQEFVLDDSDLVLTPDAGDVDPEWAPVSGAASLDEDEDSFVLQDDDDPVYGSEAGRDDEEMAPEYAEPEYAEYAESYVDSADPFAEALGHEVEVLVKRRFRLVRLLSGLAAASILIAAGAVMVLKPELLGLKVEPEIIDRVQIARPQIDLTLAPPVVEPPPEPVVPDPVTPDPVTPDPVVPDPVVPDPVTPEPVVPDPVTPDPVVPDPLIADPDPLIEDLGPLQVGETGILIGAETGTPDERILTLGVSVGSQAFAQLHNGNYFVGVVKSVAAPENVTLRVSQGEVTLALAELKTLAPLGSKEYRALQEADQGYVRLVNNSLLRGTILRHNQDDNVILQMKSNQVIIPHNEVDEVGSGQPTAVQLDDSGDMDWVRRLVEEGMDQEVKVPDLEEQPGSVRTKVDR